MADKQAIDPNFPATYFKADALYPIHYFFLKKYDKSAAEEIIYKENRKFNSRYYSIESFFKTINVSFSIIKDEMQ